MVFVLLLYHFILEVFNPFFLFSCNTPKFFSVFHKNANFLCRVALMRAFLFVQNTVKIRKTHSKKERVKESNKIKVKLSRTHGRNALLRHEKVLEYLPKKYRKKAPQVKEKHRVCLPFLSKNAHNANVCLHYGRFYDEETKKNMPIAAKSETSSFLSVMPIFSVEGAISDRLGDMVGTDGLRSVEVGDGSRDAKDPIVTARGEPEGLEGFPQKVGSVLIGRAILPQ